MEYAGAALTDLDSLPHELAHNWFGRSVMAANGNAGWIDEAMATFIGGPSFPNPNDLKALNMSGHSQYFRANDGFGYYYGTNFLGYLGQQFNLNNAAQSMNDFLREWVKLHGREVITASIFESALEQCSGMDLKNLFKKYVYGNVDPSQTPVSLDPKNYIHRRFTKEELRQLQ